MRRYIAQPVIYPINKKTTVNIIALKGKTRFEDGKEYKIFAVPMCYSRSIPKETPDATVVAKDGILSFDYEFKYECEYEIRFTDSDENPQQKTSVYALENDLYNLRPLKGDFHVHTNRSDADDDPAEVIANYRRTGYDFLCVTDHNRYFPSIEAKNAFADTKVDISIINGEEVHTPITNLHIVHVGGKSSIDNYYVKNPDKYEQEVAEIEKTMESGEYTHRMAMAKWAADKIHEAEGLAILPHPFWIQRLENAQYNINLPFLEMLFDSGYFDAYELLGAMNVHGNNLSNAYFNELRIANKALPFVASSDSHKTLNDTRRHFGNFYTVVFAKDNTRDAIIEAVKHKMTAAVEHVDKDCEENNEFRVHSSFRLTMYTRFLLDNYFSRTEEMFKAEGILMREYTLGVSGAKEALEAMSGRAETMYKHFFGIDNTSFYNTKKDKAFYDKHTEVWNEYGVVSRGSKVVYNQ
ncbi:MAG: PHP domain-containing protein [Clostridia bacterium]|nr:PHP domain-containing protein [Clostridia bacterium]